MLIIANMAMMRRVPIYTEDNKAEYNHTVFFASSAIRTHDPSILPGEEFMP
jgi:hypothetical protein